MITLGITNALNMEGFTEARRRVDRAVLAYYAGLKPKGYKLVLHAVGSSEMDREAAEGAGWLYMERSNDDRGLKRNDALDALQAKCDAIVRIGSDDLISLALLDEVARRTRIGHEGYWELRGFYVYDLPGDNLALFWGKQFALAIRTDRIRGRSHREMIRREAGKGVTVLDPPAPDDAGLDVKWRSWGAPYYRLPHHDERPMVSISSGDQLHGYGYYTRMEPTMYTLRDDSKDYIEKHFPGFLKSLTSTDSTSVKSNAKSKKNKRRSDAGVLDEQQRLDGDHESGGEQLGSAVPGE